VVLDYSAAFYNQSPFREHSSLKFNLLNLQILKVGAYLTLKLFFHKALNSVQLDCEITLESVPLTKRY